MTGKVVIAKDQKNCIHVRIQLTAFKNRSNAFGWPSISTKACKGFFQWYMYTAGEQRYVFNNFVYRTITAAHLFSILPVVWESFNGSRVGISSIIPIKKCKFEKNASTLERSSDRIWNEKRFTEANLKKKKNRVFYKAITSRSIYMVQFWGLLYA